MRGGSMTEEQIRAAVAALAKTCPICGETGVLPGHIMVCSGLPEEPVPGAPGWTRQKQRCSSERVRRAGDVSTFDKDDIGVDYYSYTPNDPNERQEHSINWRLEAPSQTEIDSANTMEQTWNLLLAGRREDMWQSDGSEEA